MEVLRAGKGLRGEGAAQHGLINEVVPHDQVMTRAKQYAEDLRAMPPLAVRAIKELATRAHNGLPLSEGLRMEGAISAVLHNTEDAKEGPRAFAEKRQPVFRGR